VSQNANVPLRTFEREQVPFGVLRVPLYSDQPHCLSAFRARRCERLLDGEMIHPGVKSKGTIRVPQGETHDA